LSPRCQLLISRITGHVDLYRRNRSANRNRQIIQVLTGRFLNTAKRTTSATVAGVAIHQLRGSRVTNRANQPREAMTPNTTPNSTSRLGDIAQHAIETATDKIPILVSKLECSTYRLTTPHNAVVEATVPRAISRYHHNFLRSNPNISAILLIAEISRRTSETA
jgi:hypothetical protein